MQSSSDDLNDPQRAAGGGILSNFGRVVTWNSTYKENATLLPTPSIVPKDNHVEASTNATRF